MLDLQTKLITEVRSIIATRLGAEDAAYVVDILSVKLYDYDIVEKCTDVAIIESKDDAILKNFAGSLYVEGRAKSTVKQYLYTIKRMQMFTGKTLTDVRTNDIMSWLATMKVGGKKNTYISSQRDTLNSLFTWMCRNGIVDKNPCDPINTIKIPHEERKSFADDEIDSLRCACKKPIERALVEFLLSSGVRVAECADTLISDVDFANKTVRVRHGKGNKYRETYINDVCKKYLLRYLEKRKGDSPYLFKSSRNEKYTTDGIRVVINGIGERASVPDTHPHRFRRTLATTLAKRGMPIQEIQRILGHSNISTTQKYIDTDRASVESSYRKYVA